MIDPVDDAFLELQREYLSELPDRLTELRADAAAFRAGQADATAALKIRFHRLAGSGGSYGFPEISEVARATEVWLATSPPASESARVDEAIERLAAIVHRSQIGVAPAGETSEARSRAVLILPPGRERDEVMAALRAAGYDVRVGDRLEDPLDVKTDERPDLVVIGTAAGEGDPSAIASSWTSRQAARPRAVVLIETLRAVDRLRAVAAGVDAVIPIERMVEQLPRYARTLARAGAPPSTVLLAEPDTGRAAEVAGSLEECNIRVVRCAMAQPIQELLEREVPDVLVVAATLPDAPGDAVIRMVRQDPRFRLLPILMLGPGDVAAQVAGLRAGVDDVLAYPIEPAVLTQTVISRAERGRRVRELLHRDELTGLLNAATLLGELENAVDHCRRHGGPLAFVVFDLDRFFEINDRYGTVVGDQVLLHVANVFRSNVRASDVIGRLAGDEFGMILRGGGSEGAAVLAEKLRTVLGEHPATTPEGDIVTLRASVGWASYPTDGENAAALAHGAHKRLEARG
ncbi:MAG TPA: diguanylate cyclase [Gemmatimonadales bacterium]|jgi:diguanylate cyclase (GGDEF)-like protein